MLANLTALELSNVSLFGFGGNSSVTTTRSLSPGTCKSMYSRCRLDSLFLVLYSPSQFLYQALNLASLPGLDELTDLLIAFPGDPMWPSDIVWDVFDLLLGGALIKTKPLASPCYTDFGDYDAEQCEWLTANWSNDSFWQ